LALLRDLSPRWPMRGEGFIAAFVDPETTHMSYRCDGNECYSASDPDRRALLGKVVDSPQPFESHLRNISEDI
jgi:hypothetical protein